jgi:hypothetical protein
MMNSPTAVLISSSSSSELLVSTQLSVLSACRFAHMAKPSAVHSSVPMTSRAVTAMPLPRMPRF